MALGNRFGHAVADARNPVGTFECDRCGFWWNRTKARKQFQWGGTALIDTGIITCPSAGCVDIPQEQFRTPILPPDPVPFSDPRVSADITNPAYAGLAPPTSVGNLGFSQFVLGSIADQTYPTTKANALAAIALASGLATPSPLTDASVTLTAQNKSVQVLSADPTRNYIALYNPWNAQVQVALAASAALGVSTNLTIGPGQANYWSTLNGLGQAWQGAVAAIGMQPGQPLWCWTSPTAATGFVIGISAIGEASIG